MKFIIFEGTKQEVENQVNDFLSTGNVEITNMLMTTRSSTRGTIVLHYLAVTYSQH